MVMKESEMAKNFVEMFTPQGILGLLISLP